MLASGNAAYNYRWINNNDVKFGGIRWTAYGNAADSADEFTWCVAQRGVACGAARSLRETPLSAHRGSSPSSPPLPLFSVRSPIDPNTGYPRQRQINVNMYCNKNGKRTDPLVTNSFWDTSDCVYRISMTHFAACGVEGDPFEYNQDPGVNFGFVILGGVLTVVFYYLFAVRHRFSRARCDAARAPARLPRARLRVVSPQPPLPPPSLPRLRSGWTRRATWSRSRAACRLSPSPSRPSSSTARAACMAVVAPRPTRASPRRARAAPPPRRWPPRPTAPRKRRPSGGGVAARSGRLAGGAGLVV